MYRFTYIINLPKDCRIPLETLVLIPYNTTKAVYNYTTILLYSTYMRYVLLCYVLCAM
jgi:hypothetical protein